MDNMISWTSQQLADFVQKIGQQDAAKIILKYKIDGVMMKEHADHQKNIKKWPMPDFEKDIIRSCIFRLRLNSMIKADVHEIIEAKWKMNKKLNEDQTGMSRESSVYLEPINPGSSENARKKHSTKKKKKSNEDQTKMSRESLVYLEPINPGSSENARNKHSTKKKNKINEDQMRMSRESLVYLEPINPESSENATNKYLTKKLRKIHGMEHKIEVEHAVATSNHKIREISNQYKKSKGSQAAQVHLNDPGLKKRDSCYSTKSYYRFVGLRKVKNKKPADEIEVDQYCMMSLPRENCRPRRCSVVSFDSDYIYAPVMMEPYDDTTVRRIKRYLAPRDLLTIPDNDYDEVISGTDNLIMFRNRQGTSAVSDGSNDRSSGRFRICGFIFKFCCYSCSFNCVRK